MTQANNPEKRPAPKPPKKQRPAEPMLPSSPLQPAQQGAAPQQPFDEDLAIVPAPSPEVFVRQKSTSKAGKSSSHKALNIRRTIVPLLLTWGLMLSALGALWFTTEPDSPYRNSGIILPIILLVIGPVLLVVGILNAFHIKHLLQTSKV